MLNKYKLACCTWYTPLNQKQVPFNVYLDNFQPLRSNPINPHVTGHSFPFENTPRSGSGSYRTGRTMPIRLPMSLWATFKSVSLNASCKSSAFGCPSNSNHITRLEYRNINLLTNLNTVKVSRSELPKITESPYSLKMAFFRLIQLSLFTETKLDCFVSIFSNCLNLGNHTRASFHDRNHSRGSVLMEDLSHP